MIGKRSVFKEYYIQCGMDVVKFAVQVNKNGGICGIFPKVNKVLSDFQNRQLDSEIVEESLVNALSNACNNETQN